MDKAKITWSDCKISSKSKVVVETVTIEGEVEVRLREDKVGTFKSRRLGNTVRFQRGQVGVLKLQEVEGLDYDQVFSPVVRFETVCLILAMAALENWSITGLDLQNTYLYGTARRLCSSRREPQGDKAPPSPLRTEAGRTRVVASPESLNGKSGFHLP